MPGKKVAVAIGVASVKSKKFPFLGGALNGARAFHEWASTLGYDSSLVTDEEDDVTVDRLRDVFDSVLAEPLQRLVVYFAGHGIFRELDDVLWLLSDSYKEGVAVGMNALKKRLSRYDIQQVAFFSDCCSSLPPDMDTQDLTAHHILAFGKKERLEPSLDRFIAAQEGKAAFMVPGDDPEDDRCIFSGLLLEALWGTKPGAFSKLAAGKVTSSSLGQFLKQEAPKLAGTYGLKLDPRYNSGFPEDDNVYFPEGAPPEPPRFSPWPPPDRLLQKMGSSEDWDILADVEDDDEDDEADFAGDATISRDAMAPEAGESLLEKVRNQERPQSFETRSGFAVAGGIVKGLWTAAGISACQSHESAWWCVGGEGLSPLKSHAPVLIEFKDGLFAAATALPDFVAALLREPRGVSALVYRKIGEPDKSAEITEEALAAMEAGTLHSDAATTLAAKLRRWKHVDPVLGIVSAYLYDSIGDIDSIRRMAFYYVQHEQPIPYDIALLAQIRGGRTDSGLWVKVPAIKKRRPRTETEEKFKWTFEATPEVEGAVAGFWPWMRQGWTFLDDPAEDGSTLILPGLIELIRHVRPARFATLDTDGGKRLAELFGLTVFSKPKKRN